jgi:hypothetical protein
MTPKVKPAVRQGLFAGDPSSGAVRITTPPLERQMTDGIVRQFSA